MKSREAAAPSPAAIAAKLTKVFNRHAAAALARLYARDQVTELPGFSEPIRGRKAKREMVAGFFRAFPDLRIDSPLVLVSGDYAVCEGTMTGTNTGPMASPEGDLPPTGRCVSLPICYILKIGPDGLVQTDHTYFDEASFARQLAGPPSAQPANLSAAQASSNEAVVRDFIAAIDRNDFGKLKELADDDFALTAPGLVKPWKLEEVFQAIRAHYAAFPDWKHQIEDLVAEGDKVAVKVLQTGTHKAGYEGIPATNAKVTMPAAWVDVVTNGKIKEAWVIEDNLGLYSQLGMELKPATPKTTTPVAPRTEADALRDIEIEGQIRAAMQSYANAVRARDVAAIVAHYANDPAFRFIDGSEIFTYDGLVKMVREFIPSLRALDGGFGAIHVTVLSPDAALAAAPYLDIITDGEGKTTRVRGTVTWVWRRAGARWQIIHGHAVRVPDTPSAK